MHIVTLSRPASGSKNNTTPLDFSCDTPKRINVRTKWALILVCALGITIRIWSHWWAVWQTWFYAKLIIFLDTSNYIICFYSSFSSVSDVVNFDSVLKYQNSNVYTIRILDINTQWIHGVLLRITWVYLQNDFFTTENV